MKKINVGLFGFGKTGKSIVSEFMKDSQFNVRWIVRKSNADNHKYASRLLGMDSDSGMLFSTAQLSKSFFAEHPVDLIVDFSNTVGVRHYQKAADLGISIISAVSKYEPEDLHLLHSLAKKTAVLYSPNITLGINVLLVASQALQKIAPQSDIIIVEEHSIQKPEVSGTAKKIAEHLNLDHDSIRSIRAGGIVGRHEIIFGLPNQTIRLTHDSIDRSAFGQGAIFAANYLFGQPKGLYSMENIIAKMFLSSLPSYEEQTLETTLHTA